MITPKLVATGRLNPKSGGGGLDATPLAIYVHWPWCKAKCPYCDFNSHVATTIPEIDYVNSIIQELKSYSKIISEHTLTSIFFGGGTPSLMQPASIEKILQTIDDLIQIQPNTEITLEANPTSCEGARLGDFIQAGVNRLSIGVQGLEAKNLALLGRQHSPAEAIQVVEKALKYCLNVNLDLIYGLPEQDLSTWRHQLNWACQIGTTHLSAYQLTIEENTKFFSMLKRGQLNPIGPDAEREFYDCTNEVMDLNGFTHYEISNYARPGYVCQHNTHVWQYHPYVGVGAGAHGRILLENNILASTHNKKLPAQYMADIACGKFSWQTAQPLSSAEIAVENLLMSLRLPVGLNLKRAEKLLGKPIHSYLNQIELKRLQQLGMITDGPTHLAVPQPHWPLLDSILFALNK